ncbi:MAG: small basic protein (TIGR04137 family) [Cryomorphaceae bacterium]
MPNLQIRIIKRPHNKKQFFIMSKHSSLKAQGSAAGKRSVMKRFERVKALRERGLWKEGQSPTGLPKTKSTD